MQTNTGEYAPCLSTSHGNKEILLDTGTVLRRSDDVTFQAVAGEAILIHMLTGTYFSLNEVGTEFWERLDGRQTIGQHAAAIAAKYNEKTAVYIHQVQQTAVHDHHVITDLASEFDLDVALVREHAAGIAADDSYAATIATDFHVPVATVTADLLEVAQKMAADKLVEIG